MLAEAVGGVDRLAARHADDASVDLAGLLRARRHRHRDMRPDLGDDLADEENGSNTADADAIHRETLSILGDLIDLQRSPRTAGR